MQEADLAKERTSIDGSLFVGLPVLSNVVGEGIVGIGSTEQRLNAEQNRADLKRGAPLVLQDVEADPAESVDVGMVDPRQESHLRGAVERQVSNRPKCNRLIRRMAGKAPHGVIFSQEELELEDASLIRRLRRASDNNIKVTQVILVGGSADARG